MASAYGHYGYRSVTALLRNEGWIVDHKRVQRIWRKAGLKAPQKQPKRGHLWRNVASRWLAYRVSQSESPKSMRSIDRANDFMEDRTHNGVKFRILNVIDEYTRECLAAKVARRLTHKDVLAVLNELFLDRGIPVHLRSDNGLEFTAKRVREWLKTLQIRPLFIEPGSPWENGYKEDRTDQKSAARTKTIP